MGKKRGGSQPDQPPRNWPAEVVGTAPPIDVPRHGADFRQLFWPGAAGSPFSFTANQAAAVRMLWAAWLNLTPELADGTVIDYVGVGCSLSELFRNKRTIDGRAKMVRHDAWGVVILAGRTRGTHRLAGEPPRELLDHHSQLEALAIQHHGDFRRMRLTL